MLSNRSFSPAPELFDLYGLVLRILVPLETTVFYFNPTGVDCSWETLVKTSLSQQPQIVWRRADDFPGLYNQQGRNLFVMACLSSSYYEEQLKLLATSLTRLRSVKILIETQGKGSSFLASQILLLCQQHSMLNVVLFFQGWTRPFTIFSYLAFPYFKLVKQRFSAVSTASIYRNQMADLRGYQLRVQPDLSPPNLFDYQDRMGEYRLGGFMWHIIDKFAGTMRANIKILYPTWSKVKMMSAEYMIEFTRNGSSDIGLTTTMTAFKHEERYRDYSYPLLFSSWCTMLPVEKPVSVDSLFGHVLSPGTAIVLLLACVLHFLVLPWLLTFMGFTIRGRLNRVSQRIFVLVLLCASSAQLLSLLISPVLHKRIESFDDLLESDLKIFGLRNEFYFLDGAFRAKYAAAFRLSDDPNELYDHRNYFNASWAYTITTVKWKVIDAQQRHFDHPVFRFSKTMCFSGASSRGLILAPESIYRGPLHLFSLRAEQAGLIDHWMTHSFYEMVRAGRMTIKDYSSTTILQSLRIKDLRLCWLNFAVGVGLSSAVFTIELLLIYTNVFLNSL
ncbi:uncharacterized protein LOC108147150 [Drosophila elegans]|uniref:uncharacterized protein LOC108147150 n=1 Tax=Drosophila elegans TaxID=30023 RepID=UPI0007E641D9|nr:uncharacterized protein LOC108147150 [Drosophila elegans]